MRLNQIEFELCNIVDNSAAPRNQLPYIELEGSLLGDSNNIIELIGNKFAIQNDSLLSDK